MIRRTSRRAGALCLALMLVAGACGSDKASTPSATPIPTTPAPVITPATETPLPPTWTPSPTTTPPPTHTLVPTFTPRPSVTATPGLTPGAVLDDENRLIVTALQTDVTAAIQDAYTGQAPELLAAPPAVTLGYNGRIDIELTFFNEFLEQESLVTTQARLEISNGLITLVEIPGARELYGALVSDQTLRSALSIIEVSLNTAISDRAQSAQPGTRQLTAVWVYPGYLEATFSPSAG
ncbi:MAG: hypothetical protein JW966_14530 [Anaerolineae bacterium]|nr:hypothetical protein [Anaerolineae bacterium]